MARLLGDTIAVRLLLLVATCVALSIGLTWFVVELGGAVPDPELRHSADRIAGVAMALETVPPALRDHMAAASSGAEYSLHWEASLPRDAATDAPPDAGSMLKTALRRASRTTAAVVLEPRQGELAIVLSDDSVLLVSGPLRFDDEPRGLLPLSLLVISASLLCMLAARRVSRGMARFAQTAEHFGRDGIVQPLPALGPREVRNAIAAFNAMQARVDRTMSERTAMLAALSHDLRTPLARLRLRAEFLSAPDEQRRMLRDLDEMGAMIDQSLEFLRDDARAETATRLDLAVLLQGIAEEQADLGRAVTFQGPDHATIHARPLSLKRALANIVDNAVKYGSRADIDLSLDQGAACVAVSDDGPGIPEALRERVFEPFYRAEASRNRDTGGVGLGLSLARAVVRAHGGEIILSEHALGGLIVRVDLPART